MARRKRIDPPSTAADGYRALDKLAGTDPTRFYVYANPNDSECGVPFYLAKPGAQLERKRQDGPRQIAGDGISEGEVITRLGMQLVSYPMSEKREEQRTVETLANAFDKRVLKDGNVEDPMRGRHAWGRNGINPSETEWAMPRGA